MNQNFVQKRLGVTNYLPFHVLDGVLLADVDDKVRSTLCEPDRRIPRDRLGIRGALPYVWKVYGALLALCFLAKWRGHLGAFGYIMVAGCTKERRE